MELSNFGILKRTGKVGISHGMFSRCCTTSKLTIQLLMFPGDERLLRINKCDIRKNKQSSLVRREKPEINVLTFKPLLWFDMQQFFSIFQHALSQPTRLALFLKLTLLTLYSISKTMLSTFTFKGNISCWWVK